MSLISILQKIDDSLCKLIGLDKERAVTPITIELDEKILVTIIEQYKRHRQIVDWESFRDKHLETLSQETKQKLENAIGKAIASDLKIKLS